MRDSIPPSLVEITEDGLYCPAGRFHIDPSRPVETAVITHAHSDHARSGSTRCYTASAGAELVRARIGDGPEIRPVQYDSPFELGEATVSLHPAGHLLGSAQVRIAAEGTVTVVTGDFKIDPDPTCQPFQPIACDTLIAECTFGLPVYRWPDAETVLAEINQWWTDNIAAGRTSVLYVYALGKAQRVLAGLDPDIGPILTHGAVGKMTDLYRQAGVELPATRHASVEAARECKGRAVVLAPPSAGGTTWIRKFQPLSAALVSGWMRVRGRRRRRAVDRGFVLSDHADWPGLLKTIDRCDPARVGLTHGFAEPMARWINETTPRDAWVIPTRQGDRRETEED